MTVPVTFRLNRHRACGTGTTPTPPRLPATMNSALDKLYNELLEEAKKEEPEEITDAEKAKRFLEEKQVTIDRLREVRVCAYICGPCLHAC